MSRVCMGRQTPNAHFLVVGDGPSLEDMKGIFSEAKVSERVHLAGIQQGRDVHDCYHAMDLFVFASTTETQGMVLAEAMAAGVPVIALDAPGAREIVDDGRNGRLLASGNTLQFVNALSEASQLSTTRFQQWRQAALQTAQAFSREHSVKRVLDLYKDVLMRTRKTRDLGDGIWDALLRRTKQEWDIWANRLSAGAEALNQAAKEAPSPPG